MLVEIILGDFW